MIFNKFKLIINSMLKNALLEYMLLTSFSIICQKQVSFSYILIVIFKLYYLWISKIFKMQFPLA